MSFSTFNSLRPFLLIGEIILTLAFVILTGYLFAAGPLLAAIPTAALAFGLSVFVYHDVTFYLSVKSKSAEETKVKVSSFIPGLNKTIIVNGVTYVVSDSMITMEELVGMAFPKGRSGDYNLFWTYPNSNKVSKIVSDSTSRVNNFTVGVVDGQIFTLTPKLEK